MRFILVDEKLSNVLLMTTSYTSLMQFYSDMCDNGIPTQVFAITPVRTPEL